MEKAIKELKDKLGKLAIELRELGKEHKNELKPIHEAFKEMNLEEMEKPEHFLKSLVSLAKAVVKVSYQEKPTPLYGKLTLPPYDLFLPFKSKKFAENENENVSPVPGNVMYDVIKEFLETEVDSAGITKNQDSSGD
jgi:hypothetical protein